MKDYFCFDITFPTIDLDGFLPSFEKSNKSLHSHLFSRKEEIELRIFFESKTYFGKKLSMWASHINWSDFGSFIKISDENQNDRLKKIDFSNSILLGITNGTNQFEGNLEYVSIKIDAVKFYWNAVASEINTAEFYFDEAGFSIVNEFYPPLYEMDGNFRMRRYKKMDEFYKIGKAEFRPEFNFSFTDDKNKTEIKIIKEPFLKFKYQENITEIEAFRYSEIIRLVASFYLHSKIGFTLSRIRLSEHTITQRRVQKEEHPVSSCGLTSFKIYWNFHEFMQSDWQTHALKNYKKLSKVIDLFNQSLLVDSNTKLLIRFNIIEICMSGRKTSDEKFQSELTDSEKDKIYKEVSTLLLKTIKPEDHKDFLSKWEVARNKLSYKPIKSPLLKFFESQNLNPSKFPISVDSIKYIRDKLTHGSIDKVKNDQLEKANILLYRITGILILNLLGINEWTLDAKIK